MGAEGTPERGRSTGKRSRSASGSPMRPKVYLCEEPGCSKAYSRPSLLEQHMRSHTNSRPFVCTEPNCAASFIRKDHLERHILKHTEDKDKPYHCSICGKGVNAPQHLKRHEKTHYKSFKCTHPGCEESFYKHQSMKAHIRQAHEGGGLHKCEICDKTFPRPNRLQAHMQRHHSDQGKLMCDYPGCYESFRVWSALQLHIKNDHPRLECKVCGKRVVGQKGLENHILIHDEGLVVKLWGCNECGRKYHKKEDLVKHYGKEHTDVSLPSDLLYGTTADAIDCLTSTPADTPAVEESPVASSFETPIVANIPGSSPQSTHSFLVASPTPRTEQYSHQKAKELASSRQRESHNWKRMPDPLELLVNNVDTRLPCPYVSCGKLFPTQATLDRHIDIVHHKQD